ncbi:MAG: SPOR domain-containing protein [Flammeovirgaceae bacterium]
MNRIILLFFCFSLYSITSQAQDDSFIFFDGTYEQLQERADNSQKPYFIYFYANWCMPAKEMNEQTFSNKYFIKYADQKYLGLAVDGESLITEGKKLADIYQVLYYPTVIIFSPYGRELKRLYGFQSAKDLLAELRKYERSEAEPTDAEIKALEEPVYTPKKGEYMFNISAKRQPQQGYGVQVGSYNTYRNAFIRILDLEEKYNLGNVLVHVQESEDGSAMFKVILGPFRTEKQARNYINLLHKNQKINGVIVDLKKLE